MKLYAFDGERLVTQAHDLVVIGPRRDLQFVGARLALDHQGVVARRFESLFDVAKNAFAVVRNGRCLAVHEFLGRDDLAAERLPYALMSETHAEQWDLAGERLDHIEGNPGFVRIAGTGRYDDSCRCEFLDLGRRNLVIAMHAHVGAELAEILDEVVGKRIVVVDHQQHEAASLRRTGDESTQRGHDGFVVDSRLTDRR